MSDTEGLEVIDDTISVYATLGDSLPRLVCRMTRKEWDAGKEIPHLSPLAWGEAWMDSVLQKGLPNSPLGPEP